MTTEERFERIEHVTAGLAEERCRDREEFRQLWRDTQRQINDVATHLNVLTVKVADMHDRLGERIERLAEESRAAAQESRAAAQESRAAAQESRAADQRLEQRIESMVSGIGEFMRQQREKG
jgi:methyl-accepting chemotaxis protein